MNIKWFGQSWEKTKTGGRQASGSKLDKGYIGHKAAAIRNHTELFSHTDVILIFHRGIILLGGTYLRVIFFGRSA